MGWALMEKATLCWPRGALICRQNAGDPAQVTLDLAEPFEVNEDSSDLIDGTEITYELSGNSWIRRSGSPPERLTTAR